MKPKNSIKSYKYNGINFDLFQRTPSYPGSIEDGNSIEEFPYYLKPSYEQYLEVFGLNMAKPSKIYLRKTDLGEKIFQKLQEFIDEATAISLLDN